MVLAYKFKREHAESYKYLKTQDFGSLNMAQIKKIMPAKARIAPATGFT